ncbi:MAG: hypothetical protein JRM82_02805, partial [Nitrososphaerota archaeon]|nr:hypothetical protein [Nitrososphaerota archaeon]
MKESKKAVWKPRVYFSYSLRDRHLKPVLKAASEKAGWSPILADELELGRGPSDIITKVRSLIAASDLVAVLLTENYSQGVIAELSISQSSAKPTLVFVSQDRAITLSSLVVTGQGVQYYANSADLESRLVRALQSLKAAQTEAYVETSIEGSDVISELEEQMKSNVLKFKLQAQFRCQGSDAFVSWIDNTL